MAYDEEQMLHDLLSSGVNREANEWLSEGIGTLGEAWSNEDSLALVNRIYSAGAERVTAIDIDIDSDDYQNTGKLLVALGDCVMARRKVLAIGNEINLLQGFEGEADRGQRYLLLLFD